MFDLRYIRHISEFVKMLYVIQKLCYIFATVMKNIVQYNAFIFFTVV